MIYNAFIGGAVLSYLAFCYMLCCYVPKFKVMFMSLNAKLPGITIVALTVSAFVLNSWYFVVPIGVVLIIGIGLAVRGAVETMSIIIPLAMIAVFMFGIFACYMAMQYPLREISTALQ